MGSKGRRQLLRAGLVVGQWLSLCAVLSAATIYSSASIAGMVSPRIDGSWVLIGAFLTALLLGVTIESLTVLIPATALMWLVAAAVLCLLILAPTWDGSIVQTEAMQNYAINQLVVLPLLMALPGAIGAISGQLLRRLLGHSQEIVGSADRMDQTAPEARRRAWWDDRSP